MIIFGLVAAAFFLLFMVVFPGYSSRQILINWYLALPLALLLLRVLYQRTRSKPSDDPDNVTPIFWGPVDRFQNMRWQKKWCIIATLVIVPLLLKTLLHD